MADTRWKPWSKPAPSYPSWIVRNTAAGIKLDFPRETSMEEITKTVKNLTS